MMDSARLMARLGAPFRVSASPVSSGVTTQSECIMVIDRDTETSSSTHQAGRSELFLDEAPEV